MTRNLIMGLVLGNVLLFAWGRWIQAPDAIDAGVFSASTEPHLELIARPSRTDIMNVSENGRCFRLGPFSSQGAAADVSELLSERGLAVNRVSEPGKIWVGNWGQLIDLPSEEAAGRIVEKLIGGGISDAYIYSREPVVSISLGVFRSREGADDVIHLARKLGYEPVTTDRFRDDIEQWIEIELPADRPAMRPPDLAGLRLGQIENVQDQIIRIEARSCRPDTVVAISGDSEGADDSLESRVGDTGSDEPQESPE